MAFEPVQGWDAAVLAGSESTFGTTPNPAASQAFEFINVDAGPMEVGDVRGKKDRNPGRGMQNAFAEGRVKPIQFSIDASVKSRAAADTLPREAPLYKAAGLVDATSAGVSVAYSLPADPVAIAGLGPGSGFAGVSIYRVFGKSPYIYEAEQLRGGVVKTLSWSGGDTELMVKAAGDAIGKYHLGYSPNVTMTNVATSLVFSNAEEGYRFGIGWYQCENEIIQITAMNYATFTATLSRAALGSSALAHTTVPFRPYIPTLTYAGSPISEGATVTVTLDAVAIRALSFNVDLTTGMDLLPGESGSKYVQGVKALRLDLKVGLKLVCHREDVALLGKAKQRNTCAITIVQSTGSAGGVVTFSLPYCEVEPFKVPAPTNDTAILDVGLRVRDSAGNDAFTLTYT